jgi:hypothetical protein
VADILRDQKNMEIKKALRVTAKNLLTVLTIGLGTPALLFFALPAVRAFAQPPVCSTTTEDNKAATLSTKYVDVISPKGQPDKAELIIAGKLTQLSIQDVQQQLAKAISDVELPNAESHTCAQAGALVTALTTAGANLGRKQFQEAQEAAQRKFRQDLQAAQAEYLKENEQFNAAPRPQIKTKTASSVSL